MSVPTLVYGGAFDPPHVAHGRTAIHSLNYMAERYGYQELWFLPCYSDAFGVKSMEKPEHRVAMLEIMLSELSDVRLRLCTDEIEMGNRAGTYAVMKELIRTYPSRSFAYLIGTDQASMIRNWRNSRILLKTVPFVVHTRAGVHGWYGYGWYRRSPHHFVQDKAKQKPTSSTAIRKDFGAQWDVWRTEQHEHLTHGVQSYILAEGLYKGNKTNEHSLIDGF